LQDAVADLHLSNPLNRSPHRRDVVLPDGVHNLRGYVKPPTADILAALSPGGKHHGITTGRRCAVELLSWHVVNFFIFKRRGP
jgi:hypothetical protein